MKKKTLTVMGILALVLAAAAVPLVYAGQRHGSGMERGMGMGPLAHLIRAKQELGLSDQQVEAIKAVVAGAREQNAQYRQQLHSGFGEVMSTLLKNPNDLAAAQALVDQQAQTERTIKTNLLTAASKALNVLTPEQRDKLGAMMAERRAAGSHRSF